MIRLSRAVTAAGYSLVLAVLVIDSLLVYASLRTITRSNGWVDHTRQVIAELESATSALKDAETGQRGYLLTGRDDYLEPYVTAAPVMDRSLYKLQRLTADNPPQQARAARLAGQAAERMRLIRETIALRREKGPEAALDLISAGRGKTAMDEARRLANEFRDEEARLLKIRAAESEAAVRRTFATFALTSTTAFLLMIAVSTLHRREAREREKAAEAIRSSEAWLSTTLTSIGDALIATDETGRVRLMNPVAQALTGWTQAEAVGRPMIEVFPIINETTRLTVENPVDKVIREGVVVGLANHTLLIARDGTETPIDDSAAPIKDGRGNVSGVVLVFRDITERKREEDAAAERARLTAFGRDVGLTLTESLTLKEMLARCAEETVRHLDAALARIWTLGEAGDVLELQASAGLYSHIDGPHGRVPVGEYKIGRIAQDRKPHLTNDVIGDPLVPAQDWAGREGLVAFAGYPLVIEGRLIGVWAMFARHALTEDTLKAMDSVARGIASGIERKWGEQALAASEARKAAILQTALDAIITIDNQGRVVEFNPAAERTFGHDRADAVGRPLAELIIPPLLREAHARGMAETIKTGEGRILGKRIEITAMRADGSEFPVELAVTRIQTEGPPFFTAYVRNISERKRAEQRLRFLAEAGTSLASSLDYKETLGNIAHLAVNGFADFCFFDLALDDDKPLVRVAWAHTNSGRQAEMDRISEFVPHDQSSDHPVARVLRTGTTELVPVVDDEWVRRTADGPDHLQVMKRLGLSSLVSVPVPLKGKVVGVLTFCLNDPRRQFDLSDARLAEDLGRRAGVSLQNAVLYRDAEEANRAKSQFLAVLSHELRTPLNPILLAVTSMLERPTPNEDIRPNLEMIRQYVNLQARLIDDLLDVMRIVRGKMPLHWEVVDCHALIERTIPVCRSEVLGKGLRLDLALDAGHHHLNADPARLQQVFWNLIKNAVKFTPNGGTITVRTRNQSDQDGRGDRLIVEVSDSGIGIEPDVLPVIFDPFQQGESSITRKFGGLGLGLAICKGVIEGHGGLLTVASAGPNLGATFRIELRAMPDPKVAENGRPDREVKPAGQVEPTVRKILLVEDEPATLRLMAKLLRGMGHKVTTADNIASAIEAERAGDIDLIVSDIGLPDGSGLELMRQVVARRGPLSAIALTGYGMEEDIQRSREAGFTAHMTKPIDFAKLEAMIRQISH